MEALEYRVDKFIVLELKGRVDEFNTGVLRDEIHTILNTGRFHLAIDLTKTEFLSAHCLSAIWNCQRRARRLGGDIVLFSAGGKVLETIAFVRLAKVLKCLANLDEVRSYYHAHQTAAADATADSQSFSSSQAQNLAFKNSGRMRNLISRFFQFVLLFCIFAECLQNGIGSSFAGFRAFTNTAHASPAPQSADSAQSVHAERVYTLADVQQIAAAKGALSQFNELRKQERVQDLEMARSLRLPSILLTTGYLYQSNPNLLTQVANRELNQIRQRGSESEVSSFQSNSNFKIEKDVIVMSLGVVQALYTGGLYDSRIKLAQSQLREEEAKAQSETLSTQETIQNLYWGILLTKKKVELLEAKLKAARSKKLAMEKASQARTVSLLKISEAELAELMSSQNLLEANQEFKKLTESMNALMGREPDEGLHLADVPLKRIKKINEADDYLKIAENRHPDLTYAAARIDTARAYEDSLKASAVRSPKAFMLGAVDHTRGIGSDADLLNWTIGVAMSVPLYDGGRSFAEMEKSRLLLSQARLGYSEARRKLNLDIREAVSRLRESELKLAIAEKTRSLAQQRYRIAADAVERQQVPEYQLDEALIADLESQIAVLLGESQYVQWTAKLQSLIGEFEI